MAVITKKLTISGDRNASNSLNIPDLGSVTSVTISGLGTSNYTHTVTGTAVTVTLKNAPYNQRQNLGTETGSLSYTDPGSTGYTNCFYYRPSLGHAYLGTTVSGGASSCPSSYTFSVQGDQYCYYQATITYENVTSDAVIYPVANHKTSNAGGRKMVVLSNGWFVAVTKVNDYFYFHINRHDGTGWQQLCHLYDGSINENDIAITAVGTKVYAVWGRGNTDVRMNTIDVLTVTNANHASTNQVILQTGLYGIDSLSLIPDKTGQELHLSWSAKGASGGSNRLFYRKMEIGKETGIVSTGSSVVTVASFSSTAVGFISPSIVMDKNNMPVIFTATTGNNTITSTTGTVSGFAIIVFRNDKTLTTHASVHADWSYQNILNEWHGTATKNQASPVAVTDKDGNIHLSWAGYSSTSTYPAIRYTKSEDNALNWQPVNNITEPTNNAQMPTITADKDNVVYISYSSVESSEGSIRMRAVKGDVIEPETVVKTFNTTALTYPQTIYDPGFSMKFNGQPPTAYTDTDGVRYLGTFSLNEAPKIAFPLSEPSGDYQEKPSFDYAVTDDDGDSITVTESIDGVVFNTRENVASGTILTYTPDDYTWICTRPNEEIHIEITADDGNGDITTVRYPITRTVPSIEIQLKEPFETDVAARRIAINFDGFPKRSTGIEVYACNNGFDSEPAWENVTNLAMIGLAYPFENKTKTADKWGVSFKVKIERGTATEEIFLNGIGGAFD